MTGRNVRIRTERKARTLTDDCTLDFPLQWPRHVAPGSLSSTRHEHLLQALVEVSTKSGQLQMALSAGLDIRVLLEFFLTTRLAQGARISIPTTFTHRVEARLSPVVRGIGFAHIRVPTALLTRDFRMSPDLACPF